MLLISNQGRLWNFVKYFVVSKFLIKCFEKKSSFSKVARVFHLFSVSIFLDHLRKTGTKTIYLGK